MESRVRRGKTARRWLLLVWGLFISPPSVPGSLWTSSVCEPLSLCTQRSLSALSPVPAQRCTLYVQFRLEMRALRGDSVRKNERSGPLWTKKKFTIFEVLTKGHDRRADSSTKTRNTFSQDTELSTKSTTTQTQTRTGGDTPSRNFKKLVTNPYIDNSMKTLHVWLGDHFKYSTFKWWSEMCGPN